MSESPESVTHHRSDTPPVLAELIMRCLAKDADQRPQSAQELVRILETVTSGGSHSALPSILVGGPGMFRKALMFYAAAFVVVLVVAQAAVIAIGLPDWVVPGATVIMLMGLPVILFTGYVQRIARKSITTTAEQRGTQGTLATLALKASPHLSWQRTAKGGVIAVMAFVLLIGSFMTLRALGIGPAGSLLAAGKLGANDAILVADFGIKGADSSLGSVVAEAIRTDLGQSRAVTVMPSSAVRAALTRMKRPADSHLDLALARDIAQREGVKAVVHGDITPLGTGFIVSARLVTAGTGDELASFHETADSPRDLIPTVQKLSRSLRSKMGESLRSVRATPALADVTTASLEALQKFTEGSQIADLDAAKAIALLKEAVAIDTGFAMAWRRLGVMYSNAGYPQALRDSAIVRAFRSRERLTQSERDNVEGYYYGTIVRDRAREMQIYERVLARGEFGSAAHNLALRYLGRREPARAESIYTRYIATGNAPMVSYQNLAWAYAEQGKWDSSDAAIRMGNERFQNPMLMKRMHATLLYARGQTDTALKLATQLRDGRDAFGRVAGYRFLAEVDATHGRLAAASRGFAQTSAANAARGGSVDALNDTGRVAMYDAWFRGHPERTVQRLDASLRAVNWAALSVDQRPYFDFSWIYAMAGRPDKAKGMLARYDSDVRDTSRRRMDLQRRQFSEAEIALTEKRYADALSLARQSDQLPDGPADACGACQFAVLARVFDVSGQIDSAAVYYERYIATPSAFRVINGVDALFLAGSYKRLGEIYEERGDRTRAVANYQKFVDVWKDADPELQPKVADVRRRIARLSAVERR